LNIIGFVKPVLLGDVVHWVRHRAFSFCKEWLFLSKILVCFINQLECGHSDWLLLNLERPFPWTSAGKWRLWLIWLS